VQAIQKEANLESLPYHSCPWQCQNSIINAAFILPFPAYVLWKNV